MSVGVSSGADYVPSVAIPPAPSREFRAAWVATVKNIDWPSQPGLTSAQQKAELLGILDRAAQLRLNAIILQVRPASDALYSSRLEPWSEFLTGQMGRAPWPHYDPLAFAVEEAHKRGLELHAWFNPFRARHNPGLSPAASTHVTRKHPSWVRSYGKNLWLDPGDPAVRDHVTSVILDVVKRYDIDGVHLDDYFYPYPEKLKGGKKLDFPDEAIWKGYVSAGGKLARADWRRNNVDRFIERLSRGIKAARPSVKFGVSPFGIWRPGQPPQIEGLDAYNELYADARKWFAQGWVDYLSPQLYWPVEPPKQSYPALLKWWAEQNVSKRHLWPGNALSRPGSADPAREIVNQVRLTRQQKGAGGNVLWHMKTLMQNRGGVADALMREVYAQPALVPASPWIDPVRPGRPELRVPKRPSPGSLRISWEPTGREQVWLWVLQTQSSGQWETVILPGRQTSYTLDRSAGAERIALTAIDRCGNAGTPAVVEKMAGAPR